MHARDAEDKQWEATACADGDEESKTAEELKEEAESEEDVESVTSRVTLSTRTTQASTAGSHSTITNPTAPAPGSGSAGTTSDPPAARPFEAASKFVASVQAFADRNRQHAAAKAGQAPQVTPATSVRGILHRRGASAGPKTTQELPVNEETTEEDMNLFKLA